MVIVFASLAILCLFSAATLVVAEGEEADCFSQESCRDHTSAFHLKIVAIASILVASIVGVCIPIVGRSCEALKPHKDLFFVIKAFAGGVILATGFVHILPDAFEALTNECLKKRSWMKFPFGGFIAMVATIGVLIVDAAATSYYQRRQNLKVDMADISSKELGINVSEERDSSRNGCGHGHNTAVSHPGSSLARHRVISQVLELGIVTHSMIIGISLGASESPCTVRPLIAALTFHQFFEGMGLGGCIAQAGFKDRSAAVMALFFSVTTPLGVGVGIAISSTYNGSSATALIVEGLFEAASAGILIYMSLVDVLAPDFLQSRMQSKPALQVWACSALLLGAGAMSLLAMWA